MNKGGEIIDLRNAFAYKPLFSRSQASTFLMKEQLLASIPVVYINLLEFMPF